MNRRLEVIANGLAECLNFILLAAIETVLLLNFMKLWPQMWRIMVPMLAAVFFYFLREKCRNVLLFFAGHLLPVILVAAMLGDTVYERTLLAIGVVILAGMSIRRQLSGSEDKGTEAVPVIAAAGLFLGLYLLDYGAGEGAASVYLLQMLFGYLAGYFVYAYITGFLNYIDVNNRTAEHIPEKRAFGVSFGMMAVFTFVSLLFTFLMTNRELIEKTGRAIRELMMRIIRFLTSFLPEYEPGAVEVQRTTQISGEKIVLPAGETSWIVQIMDVILTLFALGIIILFVGNLILTLYRMIKNASWGSSIREKKEKEEEDKIESIFLSERQKRKTEKKSGLFAVKNYNEQIRRLYYKTIWKKYQVLKEEKTAKLIKESTPRECCNQLFAEHKEAARLFVALYEKARYAKQECTKEEVRQMKNCAELLLGKR